MSSNIKQKNMIYGQEIENSLVYDDQHNFITGRTLVNGNAPIMSENINDGLQNLVDNDLYIEQRLNQLSNYTPGPKPNTAENVDNGENGTKIWNIQQDQPISILRKVVKPVQSTIRPYTLDGVNVNFVGQINGEIFIGSDTGLYVVENDQTAQIVAVPPSWHQDTVKFFSYFASENIVVFATSVGIYQLIDKIEYVESKAEHIRQLLLKNTINLPPCRSVTVDTQNGILFAGTDQGVYSAKWYQSRSLDFKRNILYFQNEGIGRTARVNDFTVLKESDGKYAKNCVVLNTDHGLFQGKYQESVADIDQKFEENDCACFASVDGHIYVCVDECLYEQSTDQKLITLPSRILAVCASGKNLYLSTQDKIYQYEIPAKSINGQFQISGTPDKITPLSISGHMVLVWHDKTLNATHIYDLCHSIDTYMGPGHYGISGNDIILYENNKIVLYGIVKFENAETAVISSLSHTIVNGDTYQNNKVLYAEYDTSTSLYRIALPDGFYDGNTKFIALNSAKKFKKLKTSTSDAKYAAIDNDGVKIFNSDLAEIVSFDIQAADIYDTGKSIFIYSGQEVSAISKFDFQIRNAAHFPYTITGIAVGSNGDSVYVNSGGVLSTITEFPNVQTSQTLSGMTVVDAKTTTILQDDFDAALQLGFLVFPTYVSAVCSFENKVITTRKYDITANAVQISPDGQNVFFLGNGISSYLIDLEFDAETKQCDVDLTYNQDSQYLNYNVFGYYSNADYDVLATDQGMVYSAISVEKQEITGVRAAEEIELSGDTVFITCGSNSITVKYGNDQQTYNGIFEDIYSFSHSDETADVLVRGESGLVNIHVSPAGENRISFTAIASNNVYAFSTISSDSTTETVDAAYSTSAGVSRLNLYSNGSFTTARIFADDNITSIFCDLMPTTTGDKPILIYVKSGQLYIYNFIDGSRSNISGIEDVEDVYYEYSEDIPNIYVLNTDKNLHRLTLNSELLIDSDTLLYSNVLSIRKTGIICVYDNENAAYDFNGFKIRIPDNDRQLEYISDSGIYTFTDGVYSFKKFVKTILPGRFTDIIRLESQNFAVLESNGRLQILSNAYDPTSVVESFSGIKAIRENDGFLETFDSNGYLTTKDGQTYIAAPSDFVKFAPVDQQYGGFLYEMFGEAENVTDILFMNSQTVFNNPANSVFHCDKTLIPSNYGIRAMSGDPSGTANFYYAKNQIVFKVNQNMEQTQLTSRITSGQIDGMLVSESNSIYLHVADVGWCYEANGKYEKIVPEGSSLAFEDLYAEYNFTGVRIFGTNNGFIRPNHVITSVSVVDEKSSYTLSQQLNIFKIYDIAENTLLVADDLGMKTIYVVSKTPNGFELDSIELDIKLGTNEANQQIPVSEFDQIIPFSSGSGQIDYIFQIGETIYVSLNGSVAQYDDLRLAGLTFNDISYINGEYSVYTKSGLYISRGAGKNYVFYEFGNQPNSPAFYNSVYTQNGNYLLAASDGTYLLTNDGHDLASQLYRHYISEYPVMHVGKWLSSDYSQVYCRSERNILYASRNSRSWTQLLSVDSGVSIRDVYMANNYEYYLATTDGVYKTSLQYQLSNDTEGVTVARASKIMNGMEEHLRDLYDYQLDDHVREWHYNSQQTKIARSIVPFINDQCLDSGACRLSASDFFQTVKNTDEIEVDNDVVYEHLFGDGDTGEIHVQCQNFVKSDSNLKCSYIVRRYVSGVTEVYVYIPSTNTYYLNHVDGTPGCRFSSSVMKRENLMQFGTNIQSTKSDMTTHYTTFTVNIEDTLLSVENILDIHVNGNSLPLKVYKDRDNAENEDSASLLYHSLVQPSQTITTPENLDHNEYGEYVFKFACFGSDAQAVKITCYDSTNGANAKQFTVKFNPNGALGSMPTQKFNIGGYKKLRKMAYSWPSDNQKIFYGWTTKINPEDNETDLPNLYRDAENFTLHESEIRPGQTVNLYAVWLTYQFSTNDTTLVLDHTSDEFYFNSGDIIETPNLGNRVVIDYGD